MAKEFSEKTITINLKRAFEKPLTKRAIAAKFALKNGVTKETRLKDIRLSNKLNETLWANGKYSAPRKITVKVVKDKEIARVMLPEEKFEPKQDKKKTEKAKEEKAAAPAKTENKAPEKKEEAKKVKKE
jgi:ribosomal protein L31E